MIEVLAYIPTRQQFITGMTTTALPDGRMLATYNEEFDQLIPVEGLNIDEIGSIMKEPPVYGPNDEVVTPAVMIEGHHVNLLVYGNLEALLLAGKPQVDENGFLLPLFERTNILSMIPGLTWEATSQVGEPPGYVGPNGVKLFDPSVVKSRNRVWFGLG